MADIPAPGDAETSFFYVHFCICMYVVCVSVSELRLVVSNLLADKQASNIPIYRHTNTTVRNGVIYMGFQRTPNGTVQSKALHLLL